jgi:hypothetical protein
MKKEGYHRALRDGKLSYSAINKLLNFMRKRGMTIEKLRTQAVKKDKYLEIYFCQMKQIKDKSNPLKLEVLQ